jgi:hypothetical protein
MATRETCLAKTSPLCSGAKHLFIPLLSLCSLVLFFCFSYSLFTFSCFLSAFHAFFLLFRASSQFLLISAFSLPSFRFCNFTRQAVFISYWKEQWLMISSIIDHVTFFEPHFLVRKPTIYVQWRRWRYGRTLKIWWGAAGSWRISFSDVKFKFRARYVMICMSHVILASAVQQSDQDYCLFHFEQRTNQSRYRLWLFHV